MRKMLFLLGFIAFTSLIFTFPSCRSSKIGTKLEDMPCFGRKFWSSKDYLIASGTATSTDRSTAIDMANLRARSALAQKMNSAMEFASEMYTKNFIVGEREDLKTKFRNYALNYGAIELGFISTICEEMHSRRDGKYDFYVAIQVDTESVMRSFERGLRDEEIDLEFDREQFRKIYEEKIQEYKDSR